MQEQVNYNLAIASKYPEQVVIAVARDPGGKCNPIALGWTMITSAAPPMMAVSIGARQYSVGAFRHALEFVISFPSVPMEADMLYFGTASGRDVDKLAARHTSTQPATVIDCVLLSEAVANFECVLEKDVQTGDHVLFVGRVVAAHVNADARVKRLMNFGGGRFAGAIPGAIES